MLFCRVILVQGGKCEEKKKKDQMENSPTGQPTPQKRWGPCVLISPCTRQGPLFANAPPIVAGSLGGAFVCIACLRVAIIFLGVAEGLENIEKQDHQAVTFFYPWFNNRSVFFYNMYVDVSEWSIQNAGTVVCVYVFGCFQSLISFQLGYFF